MQTPGLDAPSWTGAGNSSCTFHKHIMVNGARAGPRGEAQKVTDNAGNAGVAGCLARSRILQMIVFYFS